MKTLPLTAVVARGVALILALLLAQAEASAAPWPDEGEMPGFRGATEWLNSPPLTPKALRGKVVLVNFWTYTCINWLRSFPHVRAWAEKFRDQGLVVIGVHAPEFSFEHDVRNVRAALAARQIEFPVAIDNDLAVWRAFDNQAWPATYVVDGQGRIRHHHFGEGDYDQTEAVIRQLLAESHGAELPRTFVPVVARGPEAAADWQNLESPENYLGSRRTENFSSNRRRVNQHRVYFPPERLSLNHWALAGDWKIGSEAITLIEAGGRIRYRFHARDLHLVMGSASPGRTVRFRVLLEGKPPGAAHGADVDEQGNGVVNEPRLYQLIRQTGEVRDRDFEIEFIDAGVEAFSFTFG